MSIKFIKTVTLPITIFCVTITAIALYLNPENIYAMVSTSIASHTLLGLSLYVVGYNNGYKRK